MAKQSAPSNVTTTTKDNPSDMDLLDKQILNVIQTAFPMAERPYQAIADEIGLTEAETIERIRRLRRENVYGRLAASLIRADWATRPH
jgi:DNA-binding Lrp family transcriptional regulator